MSDPLIVTETHSGGIALHRQKKTPYNQLANKSLLTKYMLARMHTHPSEATVATIFFVAPA